MGGPDAAKLSAFAEATAGGFDVLACDRCGGRLRLIALIQQAEVIGRILTHLGLPADRPARRRPFLEV
jgi:hypothetical protein